ncbi:hypothetical protein [Nocardiopsis synnemataformans]|uniref:hypothetical protein n=1 Tax=Nocardiopsis synnemataformans TaxID=61305 RepID=UPI003EBA2971
MPRPALTGPYQQPHCTTTQAPPDPTSSPWAGYCTLAQARTRLGISRDQIITWESQGLVRCARDARGHRRVWVADLDALAEHQPGPLLAPAQAALVVGVQAEYLTRMARSGLVGCVVLPSGQRRFAMAELQRVVTRRSVTSTRADHDQALAPPPATTPEHTHLVPGLACAPHARVTPRKAS